MTKANRNSRYGVATLSFLFVATSVHATSFWPWNEMLVPDANGRYYVVAKFVPSSDSNPGKVSLTLAEKKADMPRVQSAAARGARLEGHNVVVDPQIRVRDGDTILGVAEIEEWPAKILVSGHGKGFVTLDTWGFNSAGKDALMIFSNTGELLHRRERTELFDAPAESHFFRHDGVVGWVKGYWLDDRRDELIVVGLDTREEITTLPLVTIGLTDGKRVAADTTVLDRAINERNPVGLSQALELVYQIKSKATKQAWPTILNDPNSTLYNRLQAAALLAQNDDRQGVELIRKTIVERVNADEAGAQYYAIKKVRQIFRDEAAAIICNHIRNCGQGNIGAWDEMLRIPTEKAVPELRKLIARAESVESQLFGISSLEAKGRLAKDAVPDLIRILNDEERTSNASGWKFSTHAFSAKALGEIGPDAEAALPRLIELAKERAPQEWERVKLGNPKMGTNTSARRYSDDDYVEAICRIRAKD